MSQTSPELGYVVLAQVEVRVWQVALGDSPAPGQPRTRRDLTCTVSYTDEWRPVTGIIKLAGARARRTSLAGDADGPNGLSKRFKIVAVAVVAEIPGKWPSEPPDRISVDTKTGA